MEFSDSSFYSLFCPEDGSSLAVAGEDKVDKVFIFCSGSSLPQAEDEYIESLVSKEASFSASGDEVSASQVSLFCRRSESVRWILKMKSCFGFCSQTAYLAVTYLDRFYFRRTIDEEKKWAAMLLSIACLSLAAKMEECSPPVLSDYRLGEYRFSSKVILRMELLVLDTLEWRLSSVTPFTYLCYFASKFSSGLCSKDLLSRAAEFIFVIVEAMNLMDHRPSAVAAAAIFAAASGSGLTNKLLESKIGMASLPEPLDTDHVFSCYNAMIRESQKEKMTFREVSVSFDLSAYSPNVDNSSDVTGISSFSATSNKRRRLQSPNEN